MIDFDPLLTSTLLVRFVSHFEHFIRFFDFYRRGESMKNFYAYTRICISLFYFLPLFRDRSCPFLDATNHVDMSMLVIKSNAYFEQ